MREFINKKFKKLAVIASIATMLVGLPSCGKKETESNTTDTTSITTETVTETPTTAATTEVTTEEVTTEEVKGIDSLDINNNASIENAIDASLEEYGEFYKNHAMGRDEIRDMIFVINDKYTDEDGKLVIDEDRALDAYMNIKQILFSMDMKQKIDNINTVGVNIEDNITIDKHPSLIGFIDQDLSGGELIADEIKEYETLRDSQIKSLNENGNYNNEEVKAYVIKNEVTDINNNSNAISIFRKNGHKFIYAAAHDSALNMAGMEFPEDEIISVDYDGTSIETIKINPTIGERDLEADVLRLRLEGLISEEQYNDLVSEVRTEVEIIEDKEELEKKIVEKWDIKVDDANLLIRYAIYLNSMEVQRYYDYECDEQAETITDIQVKRSNTSALNNVKKLTLTI